MELRHYVEAFKQGWKLVITVFIVVLVAGAVYALTRPQQYTSTARLYVASQVRSGDPDELSQRNATAQQRVLSYVEVVNGDVLAAQVSRRLGEKIDPGEVTASLTPGTVVIDIAATDASPRRARDVAAAYAQLAPATIQSLESADAGGLPVKVSVIDRANLGDSADSGSPVLVLVLAAVLGLGLGLIVAIVRWIVRRELAPDSPGAEP